MRAQSYSGTARYNSYAKINRAVSKSTTFLLTIRKADGERRYYAGGCRVSRSTYESVGDGRRDCFITQETPTHWRHYHCRRL